MKASLWILPVLLLFLACGSSDSSNNNDDNEQQRYQLPAVPAFQIADTDSLLADVNNQLSGLDFDAFIDASFAILESRDFEAVYTDGRLPNFPGLSIDLNDISDVFYLQTIAIKSEILTVLVSFDSQVLSEQQLLSRDIFQAGLTTDIEEAEFINFQYPATYGFFGWPGSTELLFTDLLPLQSRQEAEIYLTLLNQIGRRFSQIEALLDSREAAGIVEPAFTLGFSLQQINSLLALTASETDYYSRFVSAINNISSLSANERMDMTNRLTVTIEDRVFPAYRSLAQKMSSLLAVAPSEIGFGQFEGGDEFYAFRLRKYTTTDLTAEEVHQLGLQELARIHSELRQRFDELGYPQDENLEQLFARAESSGGSIAANESLALYESIVAEAYTRLPEVFNRIPNQQLVVIGGDSGGYYIGGSADGSRPGAFYAATSFAQPYLPMRSLAYHEGVPGHHLQIALATEAEIPEFRKQNRFTAFIEGWGLYAERLAYDEGWYEGDIYGDIGRLQFEALRASRLVMDTGIHYYGWSNGQAQDFSRANIGRGDSVARYSVWPGQATAYMIGMLKILELRALSQQTLGQNYDIRNFHDQVVNDGSMPLNVLEQKVNRFLNLP